LCHLSPTSNNNITNINKSTSSAPSPWNYIHLSKKTTNSNM
jgi:hypothetical protein